MVELKTKKTKIYLKKKIYRKFFPGLGEDFLGYRDRKENFISNIYSSLSNSLTRCIRNHMVIL